MLLRRTVPLCTNVVVSDYMYNIHIIDLNKHNRDDSPQSHITCLLHHQDVSVTTAHLLGDSLNTLIKIYNVITFNIHLVTDQCSNVLEYLIKNVNCRGTTLF